MMYVGARFARSFNSKHFVLDTKKFRKFPSKHAKIKIPRPGRSKIYHAVCSESRSGYLSENRFPKSIAGRAGDQEKNSTRRKQTKEPSARLNRRGLCYCSTLRISFAFEISTTGETLSRSPPIRSFSR
ncbi:hypothetical protein EVAR_15780_1 [Eumeta japonica]|uniref:Uncharacterized protein n=1 Tax=Eumeta variegata TaxID=151549 RepID=A0A4C1TZE3_EUMVA|nr:hypothetical protein EVAR_15780_1 [Eumeta japonica]